MKTSLFFTALLVKDTKCIDDLLRAFKLGIICPCAIDTSGDKDNLSNDINYLYNFLFTFRTVSVASNQTEWVSCFWTSIPTHMQQII